MWADSGSVLKVLLGWEVLPTESHSSSGKMVYDFMPPSRFFFLLLSPPFYSACFSSTVCWSTQPIQTYMDMFVSTDWTSFSSPLDLCCQHPMHTPTQTRTYRGWCWGEGIRRCWREWSVLTHLFSSMNSKLSASICSETVCVCERERVDKKTLGCRVFVFAAVRVCVCQRIAPHFFIILWFPVWQ